MCTPKGLSPQLVAKLEGMLERFDALERMLCDPEVLADPKRTADIAREHGTLAHVAGLYRRWKQLDERRREAEAILADDSPDGELASLARDELAETAAAREDLFDEITEALVSESGQESRDVIVEIRPGTGGEEAALFAADLFRMYAKYAERSKWRLEMLNAQPTERGGFKEVIFSLSGKDVYAKMHNESGTHRVQRVPETEAQGRVHTSAATVAVLPEVEEVDVELADEDIKFETMRSSGPGGQNVNKVSSAVRLTHLPTNIVVSCQDEQSQHKNRAKAMRILRSRIYEAMMAQQHRQRDSERRAQIGSGDRSERIRTYNFPQNRVTDHRIDLTLYDLENVMLGDLDRVVTALLERERQQKLAAVEGLGR